MRKWRASFKNVRVSFCKRLAEEQDARRRELGVEDAVLELEGVTPRMAVLFGENDVKSV